MTDPRMRFGLRRATTIFVEARINNLVAVREGGGLRKRDQFYVAIESNPRGEAVLDLRSPG